MSTLKKTLQKIFSDAITQAFGQSVDPLVQVASRPEFGDYQANFALGLAKQMGAKPQEIANKVVEILKENPTFSELTVSGPGFINIKLHPVFLNQALQSLLADSHFKQLQASQKQTVVVDYGSVNVAKEMHVGHLRSAAIGDAVVRVLEFLGHTVIRQNHLGDWGTQFGMLIEYIFSENIQVDADSMLSDLTSLYKKSKEKFDADEDFARRARDRVVALQGGEPESFAVWENLVKQSERYSEQVYGRLDVLLEKTDNRGESFYNPYLPTLVDDLVAKKLAQLDQGAVVMFLPGFVDQDKKPLPMLIKKSDGGYLYATTDLAAGCYRINELKADRLIYVIDARQSLHIQMLFSALHKIGCAKENTQLEHLSFVSVLGEDKKPFKTRSGESILLLDLIDEAEKRALKIIEERNPTLSAEEKQKAAHVIGVGALKYADLSNDLVRDYVFDWNKMLSFDGNTAPYLQNAYVRIQAIFRKGKIDVNSLKRESLNITAPEEHVLVLKVLEFSEVVLTVAEDLRPHKLCTYLFELAAKFHQFYEACPILSNTDLQQRDTRLVLCGAVAHVLKTGLELLGIGTLDRM
ncbi:MAG: Arginyl-tRNA synthetase [Gammaproteobacteria bacterium]|nr:Arginyl-tRNA synthetase [Gammaproteobacteria bacterium]